MTNLKMSNKVEREGTTITQEMIIEELPAEETMIVLDKVYAATETVTDPTGGSRTRRESYVYPPGSRYGSRGTTDDLEPTGDLPQATGLDTGGFDIRNLGDLRDAAGKLFENLSVEIEKTGNDIKVTATAGGRTIRYSSQEGLDVGSADTSPPQSAPPTATATAIDCDSPGGERILETGKGHTERGRQIVWRVTATQADGETETANASNSANNTIQSTDAGIFFVSLDVNLNLFFVAQIVVQTTA